MAVDLLAETELLTERPEGGDGSETAGLHRGGSTLPLLGGDQVLELAEVDLFDATGFAVDATTADGIEVAVALDGLLLKMHLLGATIAGMGSSVKLTKRVLRTRGLRRLGATFSAG